MNPLTQAVDSIIAIFSGALGLFADSVGELYIGLTTFVILAMCFAMLARPSSLSAIALVVPLPTILLMLITAFFIEYWPVLTEGWLDLMISAGLTVSPSRSTVDFRDIGGIARTGWEVAIPIIDMQRGLSWWSDFSIMLISSATLAMVLLSYALTAIMVVFGFLGYYLLSVLAFFLLPFSILKWTAFLADGSLKYVAVSGLTLMALALNYGLMGTLLSSLEWSPALDGWTLFGYFCAVFMMLCVMVGTPFTVAKITGTQSIFSPGNAVRNMMMTAAAGGIVGGMFGGSMSGMSGGMGGAGNPGGITMRGGGGGGGGGRPIGGGAQQQIGSRVSWQ